MGGLSSKQRSAKRERLNLLTWPQTFEFLPQFFDFPFELGIAFFQGFVLGTQSFYVDVRGSAKVAFDEAA